jgi:hypothetical protein
LNVSHLDEFRLKQENRYWLKQSIRRYQQMFIAQVSYDSHPNNRTGGE